MPIYDEVFASPNFGYPSRGSRGRQGYVPEAICLHIGGANWKSNYNWIMNPNAFASYNAYIKFNGEVVSFVPESDAAWSHGRIRSATWPLLKSGVNPNVYTLSLCREGSDQRKWTDAQMQSTLKVLAHWSDKYGIKMERPYVFGHFEIDSVERWYCPGKEFFDAVIKELPKLQENPATPKPEPSDLPKIQRQIGIEVDGNKSKEVGYLINNRTYVRAAWLLGFDTNLRVTGHGDHIKVIRRGM